MPHAEFKALKRFSALDGLRALAAIMVVAFHTGGPALGFLSGWLGVQLFFVLSGFLITTLALREEERNGRISFSAFYVRRFFRIVPVYLTALLLVMGIEYLQGHFYDGIGPRILWYLTFNVEQLDTQSFGVAWTLGIEQKFYLLWPLLAFAGGAFVARRRLLRIAFVAAGLGVLFLFTSDAVYYAEILMGCTMAVLLHSERTYRFVRPLTSPVAGALAAAGAIAVQLTTPALTAATNSIFPSSFLYALSIALLIPFLLRPSRVVAVLGSRPFAWLGERSYGLYLVHEIAMVVAAAFIPQYFGTPRVGLFLAALVGGLVLADVLYRWIELPCIDLGRKLLARRRGHVAPAAPGQPALDASPQHALSGAPTVADAVVVGTTVMQAAVASALARHAEEQRVE